MEVEELEARLLLALDFGDAPDTAAGTGPGNYNTLSTDNGPRHTIVAGLFMGARVDMETEAPSNATANGDDVTTLPDDEDGLNNPAADLVLTVGAQSTVNVIVTNTTGSAATLFGWIDYDANGVFDNATERAQATVSIGTSGAIVTLLFPIVPPGFTGTTYARLRLSTDAAAANPTGAASNGEVEDYVARISNPSDGTADSLKSKEIAHQTSGGPTLVDGDFFGNSATSLGDLDGDGVSDLAVGAFGDETGGADHGAVYVLFMNSSGTVKSRTKIASVTGGGPPLLNSDRFGSSVASLGDLDGDGVSDLAVGAFEDDTRGVDRGAVYVLFMNANGTVKSTTKIASGTGGGPTLANGDVFGGSVASLGDLDGDGVSDLAVGAFADDTGGVDRGAVYVLFMNSNGTVKSATKIASGTGGGPTLVNGDVFGRSMASLADLDGDGVSDLAVAATGDDTGGVNRGAVYVLFMNSNGTVKSRTKIASGTGGGPTPVFGRSVASLGDLDGDGVGDLAVGSEGDDTGGSFRGAVYVLFMNSNGTVKSTTKIASGTAGGPTLANFDSFGNSVASLGDLDGDGVSDLAVGAGGDDTGGSARGAVYVLFLNPPPTVTLSLTGSPLAENGGVATVTATLSAVSGQTVTVDLGFTGTATNVSDYTRSATSIVIAAGSTSGSITLTGVNDVLDEANETIIVDITGVTNGAESGMQQVTAVITDDDPAPTVTLSLAGSPLAENGGVATVTATLSAVSGQTVAVDLGFTGTATNVTDYIQSATSIVIAAGSTSGSITLTGVDDALDEANETIIVDITGVTNGAESGTQQVTAIIVDDDLDSVVTLSLSGSPLAENGGVATVTATLSAVSGQTVLVDLVFTGTATNVSDYTRSRTFIVIAAGATTGSITLTGVDDARDEPDETIVMDITMVVNATESGTQQVTVTITDDDPAQDFGDAPTAAQSGFPASYPTTLADDGARHTATEPRLGANRDSEAEGQPTANADSDDTAGTADEDGITFVSSLLASSTSSTTASVTISLQNPDPSSNKLDAWIDWNRDGDWLDAGEQIFANQSLGTTADSVTLSYTIPQDTGANVDLGDTYARFRLSTAGGLVPSGPAADGEVEDYKVTISAASGGSASVNLPLGGGVTEVLISSGALFVRRGGTTLLAVPAAALNTLAIQGTADDDNTRVDFSGGNPVPVGGLTFQGGSGGNDSLTVTAGAFASVTHNLIGPGVGNIDLGSDSTIDISYSGLEPIDMTGSTATDLVFNLPAGGSNAILDDAGTPSDGLMRLRSASVAFEETTFANPSATLTINVGAAADTVTLTSLDSLFGGSITVNGNEGDDVLNASTLTVAVRLRGDPGNDRITGGDGDDTLVGGAGDDVYQFEIATALETDTVVELLDEGTDRLDFSALAADDPVTVNLSSDAPIAFHTNRTVNTGGAGQSLNFEQIMGGAANDSLTGGPGLRDTVVDTRDTSYTLTDSCLGIGEICTDQLISIEQAVLTGGDSNNRIDASAFSGLTTLNGGGGDDTLRGAIDADVLIGGADSDLLVGGMGDDTYRFADGWGSDTVEESSNEGSETMDFSAVTSALNVTLGSVTGGDGINSVTHTGDAIETLVGGAGDDTFTLGHDGARFAAGAGRLDGGGGDNTIDYSLYTTDVSVDFDGLATAIGQIRTISTVIGGAGNDSVRCRNYTGKAVSGVLGGGNDLFDCSDFLSDVNVDGGAGNDTVAGGTAADCIRGGTGNDELIGAGGNDSLDGGADNDSLVGGAGDDRIDDRVGSNLFNGGPGQDTINDTTEPGQCAALVSTCQTGGSTAVVEGGSQDSYTVALHSKPTANVTVTIAVNPNNQVTVTPVSLTFTPSDWDIDQIVLVSAVDDHVDEGNQTATISHTSSSGDAMYNAATILSLTVEISDNDAAGITVTPTAGLATSEAGTVATFTVVLNTVPTADVTIALTSSDTTEGTVSAASLTFTPGDALTLRTVTVTGVDDTSADGEISYTIVLDAATSTDGRYNGIDPADVAVTNANNDVAGIIVVPTSGLLTTEAGSTATFRVALSSTPAASVTITLMSSDTTEGTVSTASLTFTPDNALTFQTVTVTGIDDSFSDGQIPYTVVLGAATSTDVKYNAMDPADVGVTNADNDVAGIIVVSTSGLLTTEAGGTASFRVALATTPTADVSITLTSSDTTEGTLNSALVTFTPSDALSFKLVTITGVQDLVEDGDISYTVITGTSVSEDPVYNGLNSDDVAATNTDDDTAGITVTPVAGLATTEGGGMATFTVVLNTVPTADVTIAVSSSDPTEGTVSPVVLTFTPANATTPQTVTVTGVDDTANDGDVGYTIITAPATSGDANYNGLNAADVAASNATNDDVAPFITTLGLQRDARGKKVIAFVLTFSESVTGADNLANYTLATLGRRPKPIALASVTFDAAARTARIVPIKTIAIKKITTTSLTVNGGGTIVDLSGRMLDGDANGSDGGDFVRTLNQGTILASDLAIDALL